MPPSGEIMKVLVTDVMAEEAMEVLKKDWDVTFNEASAEELPNIVQGYDAMMVRGRTKVIADVIANATNMKVIARAGSGVDNIDIKAATEKGIKVVNSPGQNSWSVAELAIGHMLSLSRFLPRANSSMKEGQWIKKKLKGQELAGKTLGILGAGTIGTMIAEIAHKGFGMKVIYHNRHHNESVESKANATYVPKEEVFSTADYVSINMPLTDQTRGMVNSSLLSLMKPTAFLIDCGRGGIVDEGDLYSILKEGKIAGAAKDVFASEPPEGSSLLQLDNLYTTPHIGATTKEAQIRAGIVAAEQLTKVLKGQAPDHIVNPEVVS